MPWCDTDAMAAHLIEISAAVDPGAHAVLIVDQAGWHLTPKLAIPDNITVLALPPRSPELNPVENVWQFMRDRLMALDVDQLCGAGVHERSAGRVNHRNGYRPRRWETRAGTVDVQIPKLRKGTYFPEFPEPRRASEKAMTAVIQEACIQGVSTRSVDDLVKTMGMTGVSKSQVSRLCVEIDERVDAFLDRPLELANGPISGWTPPTSRCGVRDGSSAWQP